MGEHRLAYKLLRFLPKEDEKIDYLLCKVNQKPLPCDGFIIPTVDLHADQEPWTILQQSDEKWFFTRLKKSSDTNQRFLPSNRNGGAWKGAGPKTDIYDSGGQLIGFSKKYKYKNDKNAAHENGKWVLQEYRLGGKLENCFRAEYENYALCLLKKKDEGSSSQGAPPRSIAQMIIGEILVATGAAPPYPVGEAAAMDLDLELRGKKRRHFKS